MFSFRFQISVSLSSTLLNEAKTEQYKDLRALLQLLSSLCSKDLVGFKNVSVDILALELGLLTNIGSFCRLISHQILLKLQALI